MPCIPLPDQKMSREFLDVIYSFLRLPNGTIFALPPLPIKLKVQAE